MSLRDLTLVTNDGSGQSTEMVAANATGQEDGSVASSSTAVRQRRGRRVSVADHASPGAMIRLDDIESRLPRDVNDEFVFLDTDWSSEDAEPEPPYFCKGVGKYLVRNGAAGVITDARVDSPDGDTPNYDRLGRNGLYVVERTLGGINVADEFLACVVPSPVSEGERVPTRVLVFEE